MMEGEHESLKSLILEKINFGDVLIEEVSKYNLDGIQKLQRKIKQELNFLRKVVKIGTIKKEHIQCSNLTHFSAVINTLNTVKDCISVNKVVLFDDRKLTIDIICDAGLTWVKVIARNPKSLSQICMGDASYGVRSILDHAEDYLEAAKLNPHLFQIPKVIFVFSSGVGRNLSKKLENQGVIVQGIQLIDDVNDIDDEGDMSLKPEKGSDLSSPNIDHIKRINLDISAMLAYVSSVCNGSAELYEFPAGVLAQQAQWEKHRPQKPILDQFFEGKELYCCETAQTSFRNIVKTVGGPKEKIRAEQLLQRLTVLPDNATIEDGTSFSNVQLTSDKNLFLGGKIKARSLTVFTFGDRIGAVTVTSNDGFVRSAKQQGINFVTFVHESRALTEQKEQTRATARRSLE